MVAKHAAWAVVLPLLVVAAAKAQPEQSVTASIGNAERAADAWEAVPTRVTRQQRFLIPFRLTRAAQQELPAEVRLYVSHDRGQRWLLYQRQSPTADSFPFHAPQDGEYAFLVRTADSRGREVGPEPGHPELIVIVDTVPPRVELSVELREDAALEASWTATDPNLAPHSLRLSYQDQPAGPWHDLSVATPLPDDWRQEFTGRQHWQVDQPVEQVLVRVEVLDRAGNATTVHKSWAARDGEVAAGAGPGAWSTGRHPGDSPPSTASKPARDSLASGSQAWGNRSGTPSSVAPASETPGPARSAAARDVSGPWWSDPRPGALAARGDAPPAAWRASEIAGPSTFRFSSSPGIGNAAEQPARGPELSPDAPLSTGAWMNGPTRRASSEPAQSWPAATTDPVDSAALRLAEQYNPRITAAARMQMDYELVDVSPEQVRRIELWSTRDEGQTWAPCQNDADRRSPVDVHLPAEGLYGFRLVVSSEDAPAPRIPQDGDPADVWILVDRTRPRATITAARFGDGTASGELQIQWAASDDLLAERPVTLRFSEQPGGPWSTIASDLPNSGRYDWRLDRLPPRYLYLQLEVRDRAGNATVHELARPVIGEGRTPQAQIRSVRPIPGQRPPG